MNSLRDTVLRTSKRSGAGGGEQGEVGENVYSGTDRGGKGKGRNKEKAGSVKPAQDKDTKAAEQALGALARFLLSTRA
jgi:hypothetical protein